MKHDPAKRRARNKWTTTVLTFVLLAMWITSGRWAWVLKLAVVNIGAEDGLLRVGWSDSGFAPSSAPISLVTNRRIDRINWSFDQTWMFTKTTLTGASSSVIYWPLWTLIVITALPAGWLWWRDWCRVMPGLCSKCGYDLHGAEHTVCPECGQNPVFFGRQGRYDAWNTAEPGKGYDAKAAEWRAKLPPPQEDKADGENDAGTGEAGGDGG